jgi:hypothetical protein
MVTINSDEIHIYFIPFRVHTADCRTPNAYKGDDSVVNLVVRKCLRDLLTPNAKAQMMTARPPFVWTLDGARLGQQGSDAQRTGSETIF